VLQTACENGWGVARHLSSINEGKVIYFGISSACFKLKNTISGKHTNEKFEIALELSKKYEEKQQKEGGSARGRGQYQPYQGYNFQGDFPKYERVSFCFSTQVLFFIGAFQGLGQMQPYQ